MEPGLLRIKVTRMSRLRFCRKTVGQGVADVLIDAFVTGIFAGDPKQLSVKSAFPMLRTMERDYGSLIKAQKNKKAKSAMKPQLLSFRNGLGTLTQALASKVDVRCSQAVQKIQKRGRQYIIHTADSSEQFDAIILATQRMLAAKLTQDSVKNT